MQLAQLQHLYENRIDGESLTKTWERLQNEGPLKPVQTGTALVSARQEEPQAPDLSYTGDIIIPRFKIIQPSCQLEGLTPGCFFNTITFEETDTLENVVFLTRQDSRSLFPEGDFSGERRCCSFNGYTPAKDYIFTKTGQEPIAPVCAKREDGKLVLCCPLAQWKNALGEPDPRGTKPPSCKASIAFLGVDTSAFMPFIVIFHGSALPIIKNFLRYINYKCEAGRRQGKEMGLHHFKLNITLEQQTNAKGRYFTPVFEKKEEITDHEELSLLGQCYENFKDWFLSDPMESGDQE